jgi:hypothetical protein
MHTKPIPAPKNWQDLQPHSLAELVEFGAGIDLDALAEYMRQHGYDPDEAIVLHDNMILDGRHRLRAAALAGVVPTFKQFVGKNAFAYVAKKLYRQHLDTSQRAMMAATLTRLSPLAGVQNCTPPTLAEAGKMLNVSRRSVAHAAKVQEEGTPALNQAVMDGTIAVGDAAKVAAHPPAVQDQAVKAVRDGLAGTASQAAEEKLSTVDIAQVARGSDGASASPTPRHISGSTLFGEREWKDFYSDFGRLFRHVGKAGGFYGKANTNEAGELKKKLVEWREKFREWVERISGKKPYPDISDMVRGRE